MSARPFQRIFVGLGVFLAICFIAVAGYASQGWTVSDSIYMVVITIFGVGYSEVRPIETTLLRTLTILVIVFGYAAAIYAVGGFIQLVIDGELQSLFRSRQMSQGIAGLRKHSIVCGFGRMGSLVADELHQHGLPFVVVDESESRVAEAHASGYLAMQGNATEEDTLAEAGIEHAKALATLLPDDALNAFTCVTARDMNRSVEMIARGESLFAEKKLRRCGADHVVMAASIGAKRASQLLVRPTAASVLGSAGSSDNINSELTSIGLQLEELLVEPDSMLAGKPLSTVDVRGNRGFLIVGIRSKSGETTMNPSGTTLLNSGDVVIVVGHQDDIAKLCQINTFRRQKFTSHGATSS